MKITRDRVRIAQADVVNEFAFLPSVGVARLGVGRHIDAAKRRCQRLDDKLDFLAELRAPLLTLPATTGVEIEQHHEVVECIDERKALENELVTRLVQEIADAVVGEIVPVLRPQALIDDNERRVVNLLQKAVVEAVLDDLRPFDVLDRLEGALEAESSGREDEHLA